jgi:hypothetical protein
LTPVSVGEDPLITLDVADGPGEVEIVGEVVVLAIDVVDSPNDAQSPWRGTYLVKLWGAAVDKN